MHFYATYPQLKEKFLQLSTYCLTNNFIIVVWLVADLANRPISISLKKHYPVGWAPLIKCSKSLIFFLLWNKWQISFSLDFRDKHILSLIQEQFTLGSLLKNSLLFKPLPLSVQLSLKLWNWSPCGFNVYVFVFVHNLLFSPLNFPPLSTTLNRFYGYKHLLHCLLLPQHTLSCSSFFTSLSLLGTRDAYP